jgi:hypothetical protein
MRWQMRVIKANPVASICPLVGSQSMAGWASAEVAVAGTLLQPRQCSDEKSLQDDCKDRDWSAHLCLERMFLEGFLQMS